jgi:hypothetical protein
MSASGGEKRRRRRERRLLDFHESGSARAAMVAVAATFGFLLLQVARTLISVRP